ncbi:hypothetical protein JCM12294_33080 [Desulfocicer niacini]
MWASYHEAGKRVHGFDVKIMRFVNNWSTQWNKGNDIYERYRQMDAYYGRIADVSGHGFCPS